LVFIDCYKAYIFASSGGGAVNVLPVSQSGRLSNEIPLIYGHQGAVTDLDFSPFAKVCCLFMLCYVNIIEYFSNGV
jgi:hypothetical protein